MWGGRLYFLLILLSIIAPIVSAFLCSLSSQDHRTDRTHYYNAASNEDDDDEGSLFDEASLFEDNLFLERFKRRRDEAASKIEAERLLRPPSSAMDCKGTIGRITNDIFIHQCTLLIISVTIMLLGSQRSSRIYSKWFT